MARTLGVVKSEIWEPVSDFRQLTPLTQWAYLMLLSQPQISNLGILPYTPEKWVRLAVGLTTDELEQTIDRLDEHRFTITDRDTAEILVRTFIKHDKVWSQPKLVTNARRLIREVESDTIRQRLLDRHPWLVNDWPHDQVKAFETCGKPLPAEPLTEVLPEPLTEDLTQGVTEPPRKPQSAPRARTHAAPAPTPTPTPTASTAREQTATSPAAALPAAEWHTLQIDLTQLGWRPDQIQQAAHDPQRAHAALTRAEAEADQNVGGYAWTLFAGTDTLERVSRRENGRRITGCRITGTGGHVYDPLGTDDPPQGWPHERPPQSEIAEARAGTNGHRKTPLDRALALVPVTLWDYDPVALGHELDHLGVTDAAERRSVGAAVEAERLVRGVQIEEGAA